MRSATVVLPVPGLPVKLIGNVGVSCARPMLRRARSTRSRAAVSRIRFLTGASPIRSRSSSASTSLTPDASYSARKSTVVGRAGGSSASVVAADMGHSLAVAATRWPISGIGSGDIAHEPAAALMALQLESWFFRWPVDDERELHRLPAMGGVKGYHADVAVAVSLAAIGKLKHQGSGIRVVEHGMAPHLPVGVARMRIVSKFKANGPAIIDAILNL